MSKLLMRYQSGTHDQVYQQLLALGPAVRSNPTLGEARAVAAEMMRRARHNIELIVTRLRQLGYAFEEEQSHAQFSLDRSIQSVIQQAQEEANDLDPQFRGVFDQIQQAKAQQFGTLSGDPQRLMKPHQVQQPPPSACLAWHLPDAALLAELDAFEEQVGPLPIVLRAWYEQVGILDLRGDHPRLSRYRSAGPTSDPLCLWFESYQVIDEWERDQASGRTRLRLYRLSLAPDACHKANTSGGGPLEIKVPNPSFDGPLISEDAWDGMSFVPYLRTCFAWGGFPGLSWNPDAAAAAHEELVFLTADLLPI